VRGIKSGLPVHECLKIIARESPAPLGPEFQILSRAWAWA
jgi:tight adherence protein B